MKSLGSFNLKAIGLFSTCSCREGILKSLCESADSRRRDLVKLPHIKETMNGTRTFIARTSRGLSHGRQSGRARFASQIWRASERNVGARKWNALWREVTGLLTAQNPPVVSTCLRDERLIRSCNIHRLWWYPPGHRLHDRSREMSFFNDDLHTGERRKLSTTLSYAMRILTLIRL